MRAYLVYVGVLLFGLIILGRIVYLQFGQGDYWKSQAEDLALKYENIEAKRGNIYGENDVLLATSVKIYDVGMDVNPKVVPDSIFFRDVEALSSEMGKLFGQSPSGFHEKLLRTRRNYKTDSVSYVLLKKDVSYAQLKKMEEFPIFKMGRYRGGLVADAHEVRAMPYKSLARRTIGYVKLAQYNVNIDLGKSKIPSEKFEKAVDTLALCMFNLFHDGNRLQTWKEFVEKSYAEHKVIHRRIDSRQLDKLKQFPIIEEMTSSTGFVYKKVLDEYKIGIEGSYDKLLSGRDGTRLVQKMGVGTWKAVNDENLVEPMNGADIFTAIDINLQDVTDNALRHCLDSNNADWGCCVLMETKTGLIKAIANLTRTRDGGFAEQLNYAVWQSIEPGSTFKLASVMALLEEGTYDTSTVVPTGTGRVGFRVVTDAHGSGYGYVSLAKAFEKSSNRGISHLTYAVFSKKLEQFKKLLVQMGLTEALGIELAGEPKPSMPIAYGDMETIPYGYVVKMTPLQILAFYNAVANNGTMVRPRFVKAVGRAGEILQKTEATVVKDKICSDQTLAKVRKLLEGVVIRGTATNLKPAACKIAGKTGTAKIYQGGKYIDKYVASFAGYFPADNPQYSCIVVVHGTSGTEYSGSQISAPVFREIADRVYATRLDIRADDAKKKARSQPPLSCIAAQRDIQKVYQVLNFKVVASNSDALWARTERMSSSVKIKPVNVNLGILADVRGMSAKDAVYILEKQGMNVRVIGAGIVKSQVPEPGTAIKEGEEVRLVLSI
jgi:cell division protein FtsI (penicillin-binding protein 3)